MARSRSARDSVFCLAFLRIDPIAWILSTGCYRFLATMRRARAVGGAGAGDRVTDHAARPLPGSNCGSPRLFRACPKFARDAWYGLGRIIRLTRSSHGGDLE